MKDTVPRLSPYVQFSETLLRSPIQNASPVRVGGEIKLISSFPSVPEMFPEFSILHLDDGVGELNLLVPLPLSREIEKYELGDLVLAEGFLFDMRRDLGIVDIIAWKLQVWKEEGGFGHVDDTSAPAHGVLDP